MGVRESFGALLAAERQAVRARRLLSQSAKRAAAGVPSDSELAARRLAVASHRLAHATFDLTRGRPLHEVVWSLPDDL